MFKNVKKIGLPSKIVAPKYIILIAFYSSTAIKGTLSSSWL